MNGCLNICINKLVYMSTCESAQCVRECEVKEGTQMHNGVKRDLFRARQES